MKSPKKTRANKLMRKSKTKPLVIGCSGAVDIAKKISIKINGEYSELFNRPFPDGESYVRFKKSLRGRTVVLVQSICTPDPNNKLIEVILAGHTAKELGAKKVILAATYLAYLRQDKRFFSGEAVSNKIMATHLKVFDSIVVVDPHLHRINSLNDIFTIKTKKASANKAIADYIKKHFKHALIVGPDSESYQWARTIAEMVNCHAVVLKKKRYNSRHVKIRMDENLELKNKDVVIVDDIISTGHTMIETVKEAKRLGAKRIYCICIHAIMAENAYTKLRKAGAQVVAANTIPQKFSKIDVSGAVATRILELL